MSSEMEQTPGSGVVVKCPDCAAYYRDVTWKAGMRCPKCKSDKLAPATIIEGAVDYSVADRRKGYAIEDIRFGKIAQWAGLVSAYQYSQCLAKQKAMAERGEEVPPIGQVMVNSGMLKEPEMKAVLEVYNKARPAADDEEFAHVAVRNKFVEKDKIEDLQILQRKMRNNRQMVPPLAALCFERRLMPENQIMAILRAQQKRAMGCIHEVQDLIEASKPPSVIDKYIGKKGDPMRKYRAAAFIAGFTLLLLAWLRYYGFIGGAKYVGYYCNACKGSFIAKMKKHVPIKCRLCGKRQAIYGFVCAKCRRPYGVRDRKGPKYCPYCRSGKFLEMTEELLQRIKREQRLKKEREDEEFKLHKIKVP